jgi:hypothetical protein
VSFQAIGKPLNLGYFIADDRLHRFTIKNLYIRPQLRKIEEACANEQRHKGNRPGEPEFRDGRDLRSNQNRHCASAVLEDRQCEAVLSSENDFSFLSVEALDAIPAGASFSIASDDGFWNGF